MMTFIWTLLTSKLSGPIATAVALLAVLFAVSQCGARTAAEARADGLDRELAQSRADLATCHGDVKALSLEMDHQNAVVRNLAEDSARRQQLGAEALKAARGVAESRKRQIDVILAARPEGDACIAASKLIAEQAQ